MVRPPIYLRIRDVCGARLVIATTRGPPFGDPFNWLPLVTLLYQL
jgi:hypothetical protein